jgi:hypothetical protein
MSREMTMRRLAVYLMFACAFLVSCASPGPEGGTDVATREAQLRTLQSLLQSETFAVEMAAWLDSTYYTSLGQTAPPFLTAEEETAIVQRPVREEKIATNLAAFYAVECGIGVLSERTGETPVAILESIVAGNRSKEDMLLLARFANATWKASQPFRDLTRITRDTFRPATLLVPEELEKDFDRIRQASVKLLEAMKASGNQMSTRNSASEATLEVSTAERSTRA